LPYLKKRKRNSFPVSFCTLVHYGLSMRLKKAIPVIFSFWAILVGFISAGGDKKLCSIPEGTVDVYKLAGSSKSKVMHLDPFEISSFVTYREYKVYLNQIKKDSSVAFYQSQLPDSSIALPDIYKQYVESAEYDDYPVMGISWESAMNYCRWMTLKANKDSITTVYRLPLNSEWLGAYDYLKNGSIKNDFNNDYSDWLINEMDESYYGLKYDYFYSHKKTDPPVLKRKIVIGNSYLFSMDRLLPYYWFGHYANHGYRQVGFRYVKCKVGTNERPEMEAFSYKQLFKYWGLYKNLKQ